MRFVSSTSMSCLTVFLAAGFTVASENETISTGDASTKWHSARSRDLATDEVIELRSLLQGKTEADVVALLGFPNAISNTFSEFRLEYEFGMDRICIAIRAGQVLRVANRVVINAEEQERQTGVRDDDFAGVGP